MICLAADHGGFELKEKVKKILESTGFEVKDFGAQGSNPGDDYPDFVIPAMREMQQGSNPRGIIFCRNGVGVSMLANKFKGVRAGLCFNKKHVVSARTDDDINVLALPVDYISDEEAFEIVEAFLKTNFGGAERHTRRLKKVASV